jgi:hypothetical protein
VYGQADPDRFTGTYERASCRLEVLAGDDGLVMRSTLLGPIAALVPDPVTEYRMLPAGPDLFLVRENPGSRSWLPVTFYELATGERYLHFGVRATPKVS